MKKTDLERSIGQIAEDIYNAHRDDMFLELNEVIEKKNNEINEKELKEIIDKLLPDLNKVVLNLVSAHLKDVTNKLLAILNFPTEK